MKPLGGDREEAGAVRRGGGEASATTIADNLKKAHGALPGGQRRGRVAGQAGDLDRRRGLREGDEGRPGGGRRRSSPSRTRRRSAPRSARSAASCKACHDKYRLPEAVAVGPTAPRSPGGARRLLVAVAAVVFWLLTRPDPLPASAIPAHRSTSATARRSSTPAAASRATGRRRAPGVDRGLPSGGTAVPDPGRRLLPAEPDAGRRRRASAAGARSTSSTRCARARAGRPALLPRLPLRGLPRDDDGGPPGPAGLPDEPARGEVAVARGRTCRSLAPRAPGRRPLEAGRLPHGRPSRPTPRGPPRGSAGAYLVNAPGHCGECHTPRNWLMVADASRHLAGGPHPGGEGKVPSLRGLARPEEVQGRGRPRPRAAERRDPRLRAPLERGHGRDPGEPRAASRERTSARSRSTC